MASRPQPSPDNVPPQGEGLPLAPESPIPPIDIRAVFTALDLYRSLGRLEKAVQVLEDARKTYDERILQLIERTTRTESALPVLRDTIDRHNADLRNTIDRHATDLNGLGRVAHTADKFVRIGYAILAIIGGPILLYLYHHVTLVFSK